MLVELHCHTNHSRGTKIPTEVLMSPAEVIRLAKKKGIGAVAITDHKVTTAWKEAKQEAKRQGIVFIPGQEISTRDGHLLGLGLKRPVKNMLSAEKTIKEIRSQGGIAIAPHPWDIKGDGIKEKCLLADAIEVFNSFALDRVSNMYTKRRLRNCRKPLVSGSDVHMPDMMGLSPVEVSASTAKGIISEIKKGNVKTRERYVAVGSVVSWARKRMYDSYHDVIKYIDNNYWEPKATIAKALMGFFIKHKTPLWNFFGHFAIACSHVYAAAKVLTY